MKMSVVDEEEQNTLCFIKSIAQSGEINAILFSSIRKFNLNVLHLPKNLIRRYGEPDYL